MDPAGFPSSMPQTELTKNVGYSCQKVHHSTLLLKGQFATTSVHLSDRTAVTVPEITGAFPVVWAAIFIFLYSALTPAVPNIGFCPEALCLLFVCVFCFLK